jgi:metal-responsive CopG/Arc/MetJ family transcriptional regulator
MSNITTISLPKTLADKIKHLCEGTGFTSLSSFVVYILRQIVSEDDATKKGFSKEDEEMVKQRLRSLGYMN